jgi:hypothetical protein
VASLEKEKGDKKNEENYYSGDSHCGADFAVCVR